MCELSTELCHFFRSAWNNSALVSLYFDIFSDATSVVPSIIRHALKLVKWDGYKFYATNALPLFPPSANVGPGPIPLHSGEAYFEAPDFNEPDRRLAVVDSATISPTEKRH